MNKSTIRLLSDDYIRPKKTKTDRVQDEESIQNYLNDYDEIESEDIPYLKIGIHLRYISWDKKNKCELFRFGGILSTINKEYLILAGKGGKTFSVQRYTYSDTKNILHTTRFFKKIKNTVLLQEQINNTIESSQEMINKQSEIIEKQKREISKLKKSQSQGQSQGKSQGKSKGKSQSKNQGKK
jgi:hypothetical protein